MVRHLSIPPYGTTVISPRHVIPVGARKLIDRRGTLHQNARRDSAQARVIAMTARAGRGPIIGRASSLRPRARRGDTMGMAAPLYHTAEMVRSLIEETHHWPRYETVHGEL